jgi:hypothetical protein
MSQFFASRSVSGVVAAVAASVTLGAVQLAAGRDMTGGDLTSNESGINRGAKSDRADMSRVLPSQRQTGQGQTVSIELEKSSGTSVLVRLPALFPEVAQDRPSFPTPARQPSSRQKPTVACEPMVSVLTEVSKRLQPGRCFT